MRRICAPQRRQSSTRSPRTDRIVRVTPGVNHALTLQHQIDKMRRMENPPGTVVPQDLRKRALVAYGRGWLEAAVEDWERIVDLTPDDQVSQNELGTARAELARRLRTDATKKNAGG